MTTWKAGLFSAVLCTLLWLLSPGRARLALEPGLVEIKAEVWRGPAMDAAIQAFEEASRTAHQQDPSKPIYRIVTGQTASREVSEDPTRFLLGVAGGRPPDVIDFDRYALTQWAARGAFLPLDKFLERDRTNTTPDWISTDDFYEAAWSEVFHTNPRSGEAHVYGIPNSIDNRALYYNEDLLIRAGYTGDQGEARPPKTWSELERMTLALTERDKAGRLQRIGFAPNIGHTHLYLFGWMNGGRFMSDDGRHCTLNDPRIVDALQWMTHMYDILGGAREVYAFQSGFQGGALDPFLQGKVVMLIDGFWRLDRMADFGGSMNYSVAAAPLPDHMVGTKRPTVSWIGGWCYAIPATARRPEAAWEFIRFLSSWRACQLMSEANRIVKTSQGRPYVPLQLANRKFNEAIFSKHIYNNPAADPKLRRAVQVMNDLLPQSRSRPNTPVGQLLWNQQSSATQSAIFHQQSPREALEQAREAVQRDLDHVLAPPRGTPVSWSWLLWLYILLLAAAALGVYFWNSRPGEMPADGIRWRGGWLTVLPWMIGFVVFTGGPILFSIVMSFCDYDILNPARFIGVENYRWMVTGDSLFWKSLGNTFYMALGVPLGMALSLALALLLNTKVRGVALWRTLFYLPSIVPVVASSVLWMWIFNPSAGLLNNALASLGIHGPGWLVDERTSKLSLIIMGLWASGSGMIIWLAGLSGISRTYYDAAEIDGAGRWRKFVSITLPLLSPYIFFNLVIGLIGTFQIFTQAFVMTEGGPVNSTLFYSYHLFNNAFRYLHMGYAAAMAWALFILVLALTLTQMKLAKRWVHYEGE